MPHHEVGFWSGSLLSILFVGQLLSVPFWGWLADHWGRRPVLFFGLAGLITFSACFGLSPTYGWALVARFMWGLGCGNTAVIKAYVSEITDSSNVGKAMGLLGMQWSLGQTFGPVLGGLLARPAQQHGQHHPFLNQTFFIKCPYFLACMVPVVLGLFIIVPAMMYLPETRPEHKPGSASYSRRASRPRTHSQAESLALSRSSHGSESHVQNIVGKRISNYVYIEPYDPNIDDMISDTEEGLGNSQVANVRSVLYDQRIIIAIALYALTETIYDVLDALLPIWMVNEKEQGGFGFNPTIVGAVLAIPGPVQLIWQPLVFPFLVITWGYRKVFFGSMLIFALGLAAAPFASLVCGPAYGDWLPILLVSLVNVVPGTMAITATCCAAVLINNVAPSHLKGQVNGVSETLAAALRVVAPVVFSIAFAEFSGKDAQWPFTYHSVFHVAAVWALWELFLCLSLGPDVEERKPSR
uniref:Major facilitator superfamily (MFS) profile domain-containing protein n=1 Tax=Eutreptiella gymnastica TaxID=73025 RepID=A0A7S4FSX3_9EUGL